ncbi:MAG: hypothetical protein LBH79_05395 [Nitrososphaerota archaeon]|nr:hypothetical protein [Nitrososphaerota archaeon]
MNRALILVVLIVCCLITGIIGVYAGATYLTSDTITPNENHPQPNQPDNPAYVPNSTANTTPTPTKDTMTIYVYTFGIPLDSYDSYDSDYYNSLYNKFRKTENYCSFRYKYINELLVPSQYVGFWAILHAPANAEQLALMEQLAGHPVRLSHTLECLYDDTHGLGGEMPSR